MLLKENPFLSLEGPLVTHCSLYRKGRRVQSEDVKDDLMKTKEFFKGPNNLFNCMLVY